MIAYGPVPSRRLGRSIGINHISAKTCTYSCVYCQLGRTTEFRLNRTKFYDPNLIFERVVEKVSQAKSNNEKIDYLTFVPDGEPTLDVCLAEDIALLKDIDLPIAVLTNASLLWKPDVREALLNADLVSLKIDAVSERTWHRIDRPHKSLDMNDVLKGVSQFCTEFTGSIITETMLVDGIHDLKEINEIATFISEQPINKAYIAIPTRPPAEDWVKPPKEDILNSAFLLYSEILGSAKVEFLIGYEGNEFSSTGDFEKDFLSITAVHPLREDAVRELVARNNTTWQEVADLIERKEIIELVYNEKSYFMRRILSRY